MPRKKGDKDIPKTKKAVILARKNANLSTVTAIAKEEGVSESAVRKITVSSVPPEVALMSREFETQFIEYAQANAMRAQKTAFDKIHELNAKDATIVAEKNFNMSQVYHNRPTQITGTVSELEKARQLFKRLIEFRGWEKEKAIAGIKEVFPDVDEAKLLEGEN